MIRPSSLLVFALKFLQKSMILTPWGPSAVPTGGAGVAFPAAIWSFTIACTFFAIFSNFAVGPQPHRLPALAHRSRRRLGALCRLEQLKLLDLQKVQLDGRGAPEDRHHDLERIAIEVH